jgi:hypothetical protein
VSPSAPCADPVHGVRLHAADSVIREYHSGGTYTLGLISVRFEGATVQGAKVGYKTFPGTADENSDFVPASGSETLNSGSVISMDTGVSVALDSESEGTESFTVRWSYSDPSGCSYQMSSPDNTTVVNILDNQGPLTLTAVDASRREGNSCTTCDSVGVQLMANRPAPNDVTIAYDTQDATAKAGSDYVAKHSSATLTQGKLGLLVFIGVLGDNTVEPDEHFNVVIGQQTTSGQAFTVIRKSAHVDLLNDDA